MKYVSILVIRTGRMYRSISKDPWFSNDVNREHCSREKRGKALCVGTSFRRRQRRSGVVSSCRDEVVGGKQDKDRRYTIHSPESASFIPLSLSFVPFLSFYVCVSMCVPFGFLAS